MTNFAYNNAKNAIISQMSFKLNVDYYPQIFFEKNKNFCLELKTAKKLIKKI